MKKAELNFTITLDENNLPEQIDWHATDVDEKSVCKALMISMWDAKERASMRIDLWTKDMLTDEMKQFFHQTLVSMADTLSRATGEESAAADMREFSTHFGEKLGLFENK